MMCSSIPLVKVVWTDSRTANQWFICHLNDDNNR
jgi:hypothetical protein